MDMSFGMLQQQVQKLVMTPELQQAIKLLELPTAELVEFIQEQLDQNPVLESDNDSDQGVDWEQYFKKAGDGLRQAPSADPTDNDPIMAVRWEPPLIDELRLDLRMEVNCPRDQLIGDYLLACMDERGYLRMQVSDVASALNVHTQDVEDVLNLIHQLEPVGIGSRSLEECLALQIEASHLEHEIKALALAIVAHHIEDVAAARISRIAAAQKVSLSQVQEAIDVIRSLNPHPGAGLYGDGDVKYSVPDVFIEKVEGEYVVIPNDTAMPRLVISAAYRAMLNDPDADPGARDFVRGRLNSAVWLVRAIGQRRDTITRVAECIVRKQYGFFENGIMDLRPMTLRDVAVDLGIHESTVSRATSGKYAQTPRGLFELKFFFGSGVSTSDGGSTAAVSIKRSIRDMISGEDPASPLSDQAIANALVADGIQISRRTVAKYRDELFIPASSARKRY